MTIEDCVIVAVQLVLDADLPDDLCSEAVLARAAFLAGVASEHATRYSVD